MKKSNIYLDSHASTPVDHTVLEAMLPYFHTHFGNGNHKAGWKTNSAMEEARCQVSSLIGARPSEIIFTSGATESINLAILGLANAECTRRHIITQKTEHAAVLSCIAVLQDRGFDVTILDVDSVGRIDLHQLRQAINDNTLVVAIMLVNNEIGTVQPVKEIGEICRQSGAKFFCDITQGLGWHDVNVDALNIDLAAMSSHKIYGPKGIGALFTRRMSNRVKLDPIWHGGGQERGLRPGTCNIPGIVGFGKACDIAAMKGVQISRQIRSLRDRLQHHLFSNLDGIKLNGCPLSRHPGNLNIAIPGITGEDLIGALPHIMFSTGSACASGSTQPSHVISALGVNKEVLNSTFRIGVGKYNTTTEIDDAAKSLVDTAKHLQERRKITTPLSA